MHCDHRRPGIARWLFTSLALICMSCSESPADPNAAGCSLGPISPPAKACETIVPRCPIPRPANARTLVSLFGYDPTRESIPTRVNVCPILDLAGMSIHFIVSDSDASTCVTTIDTQLQPSGDGGVTIAWRAQERALVSGQCVLTAPETSGRAIAAGPCCSTTIDISLSIEKRVQRLIVQTDWQP